MVAGSVARIGCPRTSCPEAGTMNIIVAVFLLVLAGCASRGEPASPAGSCDPVRLTADTTLPGAFPVLDMAAHGDSLKAMDHSIVIDDDGRLHLFWTRGMDWIAGEARDFARASTADLV